MQEPRRPQTEEVLLRLGPEAGDAVVAQLLGVGGRGRQRQGWPRLGAVVLAAHAAVAGRAAAVAALARVVLAARAVVAVVVRLVAAPASAPAVLAVRTRVLKLVGCLQGLAVHPCNHDHLICKNNL